MIKRVVEIEKRWDQKIPTDVIIVNNSSGHKTLDKEFLNLDGQKISNGTIFTMERKNLGGSYGAYNEAVQKYINQYDYFMFTEDDALIGGHNYTSIFKDSLSGHEHDTVLAIAGYTKNGKLGHAHGGLIFTSSEILQKLLLEYGEISHYKEMVGWHKRDIIREGEVGFGKQLTNLGITFKDHTNAPKFSFETCNLCFYDQLNINE